jgi:pyrroline-5-carboxylate reductase
MVKKGFTVYTPSKNLSEENIVLLEELLQTTGFVEKVEERFMDPLTAMSGSGPAYIYIVIEALTYGGLRVGIPRDLACKAAASTAIGASELLLAAGEHPAELRDQVTTPGGTTIEGIYELEDAQIRTAFMNAVTAATERGHQLAKEIREEALKQIQNK